MAWDKKTNFLLGKGLVLTGKPIFLGETKNQETLLLFWFSLGKSWFWAEKPT